MLCRQHVYAYQDVGHDDDDVGLTMRGACYVDDMGVQINMLAMMLMFSRCEVHAMSMAWVCISSCWP